MIIMSIMHKSEASPSPLARQNFPHQPPTLQRKPALGKNIPETQSKNHGSSRLFSTRWPLEKNLPSIHLSGRLPLLHWRIEICPVNSLPCRGILPLKKMYVYTQPKFNRSLFFTFAFSLLCSSKKLSSIHQREASPSGGSKLVPSTPSLAGELEKITMQKSKQKVIDLHVCFQPCWVLQENF